MKNVLPKILVSAIFMAINIAIHKTFSIYDSVKKLFVATILSIECFNIHTGMYR